MGNTRTVLQCRNEECDEVGGVSLHDLWSLFLARTRAEFHNAVLERRKPSAYLTTGRAYRHQTDLRRRETPARGPRSHTDIVPDFGSSSSILTCWHCLTNGTH